MPPSQRESANSNQADKESVIDRIMSPSNTHPPVPPLGYRRDQLNSGRCAGRNVQMAKSKVLEPLPTEWQRPPLIDRGNARSLRSSRSSVGGVQTSSTVRTRNQFLRRDRAMGRAHALDNPNHLPVSRHHSEEACSMRRDSGYGYRHDDEPRRPGSRPRSPGRVTAKGNSVVSAKQHNVVRDQKELQESKRASFLQSRAELPADGGEEHRSLKATLKHDVSSETIVTAQSIATPVQPPDPQKMKTLDLPTTQEETPQRDEKALSTQHKHASGDQKVIGLKNHVPQDRAKTPFIADEQTRSWLELTGFNDKSYRQDVLAKYDRVRRLEMLRDQAVEDLHNLVKPLCQNEARPSTETNDCQSDDYSSSGARDRKRKSKYDEKKRKKLRKVTIKPADATAADRNVDAKGIATSRTTKRADGERLRKKTKRRKHNRRKSSTDLSSDSESSPLVIDLTSPAKQAHPARVILQSIERTHSPSDAAAACVAGGAKTERRPHCAEIWTTIPKQTDQRRKAQCCPTDSSDTRDAGLDHGSTLKQIRSGQDTRFFVLRLPIGKYIHKSREYNIFAVNDRAAKMFASSQAEGKEVVIFFSELHSRALQGYARITTKIKPLESNIQPDWFKPLLSKGKGYSFGLEWLSVTSLSKGDVEQISDPLVTAKSLTTVKVISECTAPTGVHLIKLMDA